MAEPKLRIILEVAPKRVFASALDWPGWSRGGRTEEDALASLVEYGARYAEVARRSGMPFQPPQGDITLDIVERLTGGSGTEFGVPEQPAAVEEGPVPEPELARLIALLRAAWDTLDAAVRSAEGRPLRKGPRGGGRELQKIVDHVRDADRGYINAVGGPRPSGAEAKSWPAVRDAFVAAVEARNRGELPDRGPRGGARWQARYAIRRSAWHALDHAWEVEDRKE